MAGSTNSAVRRSAIRWNDRVRLVFADVDETIAPLYAPASAAMLRELSCYVRDGGRLFLVTGGSLQRVTSGITDGIDPVLRSGVLVAPVSGGEVWGFTRDGTLRDTPFVSRYEGAFSADDRARWREATARLIAEFGLRTHSVRPPERFHSEVGHDPQDVMFDDRGAQITLEFVNGYDLSADEAEGLPFPVPTTLGRRDLRVPVLARASQLLIDAGVPVTPCLASVFALNMTVQGVSKTSAVTDVLSSSTILASIGLTAADVAAPHSLEVWGDDFSATNGGTDLHMSEALAPSVRSIDFRDEDPAELPTDRNIVLWDGARRLQDGLLEYLTSRHRTGRE